MIKAGVQIATTNDTIISGTKSFFYPDLSAEWSGLPGFAIYGAFTGELNPVTFGSLTSQNLFLDDSLVMAHENVKTKVTGGIRGTITSKLFFNTGVSVSSVENMSFFVPSASDSARFVIAVDPEPITVFNWYGHLNWQAGSGSHVGVRTDVFSYGTNTFEKAWNMPNFRLTADWNQKYGEKWSSQVTLSSLAGMKAAAPVDAEVVALDAIFDMTLEGNYQINDQFAAFALFQNIVGGTYQRYLNYPVRGISFKLGAIYRF